MAMSWHPWFGNSTLFVDQIRQNKPLTITDPNMTRFMMTLEDAVDLVLVCVLNMVKMAIFLFKSTSSNKLRFGKGIPKN